LSNNPFNPRFDLLGIVLRGCHFNSNIKSTFQFWRLIIRVSLSKLSCCIFTHYLINKTMFFPGFHRFEFPNYSLIGPQPQLAMYWWHHHHRHKLSYLSVCGRYWLFKWRWIELLLSTFWFNWISINLLVINFLKNNWLSSTTRRI
jgi:hypothetical protein